MGLNLEKKQEVELSSG